MKAVIVGANGQLGKALSNRFTDSLAVDREHLDVTDEQALQAFDWSKYDTILNAAAYTNVDGAETPEGRVAAWAINAQAVANLAKIAAKHTLTLVHVSTEYVFDGAKSSHIENEPVSPLGVYAQAKAAGDIAAGTAPQHYILRVSWLIGDGPNFVRTMMGLAGKNISPSVVDDQIGRLTFTGQLVDGIEHLLSKQAPYGIYNLSNDGEPASWADITRTIFQELGRDDLTVTGITTAEYFKNKPEAAPRPLQSTLDLGKIKATGLVLRDWRKDLAEYIARQSQA
jgi:dTDP-4-dehydrorhamnose 3,5-epimerase/reductase